MAWPYDTVTPIRNEIYIDGTWTDVTTGDGYTRGGNRDITITRGYSSQQAQLSSGSCSFYLNNTDGIYATRNPLSPYFGLLPKWTPHRCSVAGSTTSLRLTDTSVTGSSTYDGARAWTADKSVLDITGDIDIRIDCEADDWYGRAGHILAAKYTITGNQRSWCLATDHRGYLMLIWSTDGTTTNRKTVFSTQPIPTDSGRLALRATLDVNNGAAGNTVAFYTSDTISGSWTALGSSVVTSGTTSIFSSTAVLEVGTVENGGDRGLFGTGFNCDPFCGKVYTFELRSGIGGTLVAKMDATAKARGTTSWSDGLTTPNTWTLAASAEITDADYRFHSEISEFPAEWDPTGNDVMVNITAGDIVERLTTGQKPLRSPIFRNLSQYSPDGYWPMEDDFNADRIGAFTGQPGFLTAAAFGTADGLPGTAGAISFTDDATGYASGGIVNSGAATGTAYTLFYFTMANLPAGTVEFFNMYYVGGSVYRAVLSCAGSGSFTLKIQNSDYTDLVSQTIGFGTGADPSTTWLGMRLLLTQSGGTITWSLGWYPVGGAVLYGSSGSFSGTFGKLRSWISFPYTGKSDLQLAHVFLSRTDPGFNSRPFLDSTNGYVGESARDRAMRLAGEESVPFYWIGPDQINGENRSALMGKQGLLTVTDLLQECADTDGGILFAPRDKRGLCIRSYYSMLNRSWPELDYTAGHLSGRLTPRELREFRNDVTITGANSSARYVKEAGVNSVAEVGTVDVSIPRSAASVDQLLQMAQREVLFGTWDELRQPSVQVELHRPALLADAGLSAEVTALDLGDAFALVNLPGYAGGPDDAVEFVLGYTETLTNKTRTIQFNAAPYGPFRSGIWGSSTVSTSSRWAPKYTTLNAGVNSSATSLVFSISNAREFWSTTAEPYDVKIAGEILTVTSMGSRSGSGPWTCTATVTRSVNGIVKSLPAGAAVELVDAGRWALKPGV